MCGIIGIVGRKPVAERLLEGLKRLEYRGYDSAGIATVTEVGTIDRRRAEGRLDNLDALIARDPISGQTGIGHTRWATHGSPTTQNAHPHATDLCAVVHNGIIENFAALRSELERNGCTFQTQTDTETIVHLVTKYLEEGLSPQDASFKAFDRLEGTYALVLLFKQHDNLMIGVRHGTPLTIGYGEGENYLGSDSYALVPFSPKVTFLEDGDRVVCSRESVAIYDGTGRKVERAIRQSQHTGAISGKGLYRHFMAKEIHEQPAVLSDTLQSFFQGDGSLPSLESHFDALATKDRLILASCGTALLAGRIGGYWLEELARLPVDADIASEFRYRNVVFPPNNAFLCITQSGETLDTLEAMRFARRNGQQAVCVVNTMESTIERESDLVLRTLAGPEIGVASTKAFTCQLGVMAALTLALAAKRQPQTLPRLQELSATLRLLPGLMATTLTRLEESIPAIARTLIDAKSMLFLGRGRLYPLACEGALKMKEISYIHAEAYAAGELKHGPIALIDEQMPVICLAPASDPLFEKMASNIQENAARGGRIIVITDMAGAEKLGGIAEATIQLPDVDPVWSPLLYALPLQLLAYHVAVIKGTDVDMPRNLAKSVTVE